MTQILNGIMHGHGFIDTVETYAGLKYIYLFDYHYINGYTSSAGGQNGRYLGKCKIYFEKLLTM